MEHSIDLKVNVDAREAEELKRLPEDVRRQWEALNRTLAQGPALTGPRAARMQEVAGRQQDLARMAVTQGFWTPQHQREYTKGLHEANRLYQEYWRERLEITKQGSGDLSQEIDALNKRLATMLRGRNKELLTEEGRALDRQVRELSLRSQLSPQAAQKAAQDQVRQVTQAQHQHQHLIGEMAATAAMVPVAERVSPERQRQAQDAVAQDFARRQKAYQKTYQAGLEEEKRAQDRHRKEQEQAEQKKYDEFLRRQKAYQQRYQANLDEEVQRQATRAKYQGQQEQKAGQEQRRQEQAQRRQEAEQRRQERAGGGGLGMLATASRFGRGLVGAYSVYAIASHVRRVFSEELQRGMTVTDLAQRIRPAGVPYAQFREQIGRLEPSFSPDESLKFTATYAGLAGARDPQSFFRQVKQAQSLTRGFGFSPEQGAQFFGEARQLGLATEGGQNRLAHLLAEAVQEGRLRGREGEAWQSVIDLARQAQARAGVVPELAGLTGMMARMGATGEPGLQGQFGANILANIDKALASIQLLPLSDLKKPVVYSMMASDKYKDLSFADMMEKLEAGIADPQFLKDFFQQAEEMYGQQNPELLSGLAQQMGIPLRHRREIFRILEEPQAPAALASLEKRAGGEEVVRAAFYRSPTETYRVAKELEQGKLTEEQAKVELQNVAATGTPEAEARELLAKLHQQEAALVEKLIPAYSQLLTVAVGAAGLLEKGAQLAEAGLEKVGVPKEIAGPAAAVGVLGGAGYLGLKGARRMLFGAAGKAAQAATNAAEVTGWQATAGGVGASIAAWLQPLALAALAVTKFSGDAPKGTRGRFQTGYTGALVGAVPPEATTAQNRELARARSVPLAAHEQRPTPPGAQLSRADIERLSNTAGAAHGVDPALVRAIIGEESGGWNVRGKGGEIGPMQVKPSTAGRSAAELEFPPVNIEAGTAHLAELNRQMSNLDETIAAYNSNPRRVREARARAARTGGDWRDYLPKGTTAAGEPYDTQKYLEHVKKRLAEERLTRTTPPPAAVAAQRAAEVVPPAVAARPTPPAVEDQVRDALDNMRRREEIINRDPTTRGRALPPPAGTKPTPEQLRQGHTPPEASIKRRPPLWPEIQRLEARPLPPPAVWSEIQRQQARPLPPGASIERQSPAVEPEIKRRLQEEQEEKDTRYQLSPQQQERRWETNVNIDVPPTVFTLRKETGEILDVVRVQPKVRVTGRHFLDTTSPIVRR